MNTTSIAHSRLRHGVVAIFVGLLASPWAAHATDFNWNCTDGNWATAACWNPVGIPTSSDTAFVPTVSGADTLLTVDNATGTANVSSLTIDASQGTTVTLQQTGGALSAGLEITGENAFITQSDGTHTVSGRLIVGATESTYSHYNLSGGTLNVGSSAGRSEIIGYGYGIFTQTGGTHTVHGDLILGEGHEAGGHYDLIDGSLSADGELIGYDGIGTFNQSGGTNTVGDLAVLIRYNMSGGVLTANTVTITLANNPPVEFNLSGGTLTAGTLNNKDSAVFNYSGGSLTTTSFTNNADGFLARVFFSGAGTRTVAGTVVNGNLGRMNASHTTVSFTGSVTNNGLYASDSATNQFTTLIVNDSGYLTGGTGDAFVISGDFINHSLQNTAWNTDAATLRLTGAGLHNLSLAGADLGSLVAGRSNNFAWGGFALDAGVSLQLSDGNANPGAALYVGVFTLGDGLYQLASIFSDYNIYYDPSLAGNAYLGGKTYALTGLGFLMPAAVVPTLAAGNLHTCALGSGSVQCWGDNGYGQLGNGRTRDSSTPVTVSGISTATALGARQYHSCARLTDGRVQCWGRNTSGELGNGSTALFASTPVTVSGINTATAVATGGSHACALLSTGSVQCWGDNTYGQLGDGSTNDSLYPVSVIGITTAIALGAGTAHSCALLADRTIQCWGYNGSGRLGNGNAVNSALPVPVSNISTATAIAVGNLHSCALLANGNVRCWGNNGSGRLGNGNTVRSPTPIRVSGLSGATAISAGGAHSCARLSDQSMQCWGDNTYGQLGNGSTTDAHTPVPVTGLSTVTAITTGLSHSCAALADGSAHCWGRNNAGQLGNGTLVNSSIPVAVSGINVAGATSAVGEP